jgi:hypothetical protein
MTKLFYAVTYTTLSLPSFAGLKACLSSVSKPHSCMDLVKYRIYNTHDAHIWRPPYGYGGAISA